MAVMSKERGTMNATTGPVSPAGVATSTPTGRRSSDRAFGLVFAMVFIIVACWPLLDGAPIRYWGLAVGAVLLLLAVVRPHSLALPNRWWTRFGLLLGRIVSPLALALVYYAAVVPVGILMRLLGKDNLGLRFDQSAQSYWLIRDPKAKPDDSMTNQF